MWGEGGPGFIQLECLKKRKWKRRYRCRVGSSGRPVSGPTLRSYPRSTVLLQRWPLHMKTWAALIKLAEQPGRLELGGKL